MQILETLKMRSVLAAAAVFLGTFVSISSTQKTVDRLPSAPSTNSEPEQAPSLLSLPEGAYSDRLIVESLISDDGEINTRRKKSTERQKVKNEVNTTVLSAVGDGLELCLKTKIGPFRRFFKDSKYFADSEGEYTYVEAVKICRKYSLVIGELDDLVDHRSLQLFITGGGSASHIEGGKTVFAKFYIGANDRKQEGQYQKADMKRNITFQTFHRSQPDDKDQNEDCIGLTQEVCYGPVGMADFNCESKGHVICMFDSKSECILECQESKEILTAVKERGLVSITNQVGFSYYVSNFQATWLDSLQYCLDREMILFILDENVIQHFFDKLLEWQANFTKVSIPTLEYWTAGKFQDTHMSAQIYWHTNTVYRHQTHPADHNQAFTWSGVYNWSKKKGKDPGGAEGAGGRRDLCVSFGFEGEGNALPILRNTNCYMPCYFVCVKEKEKREKEVPDE